MSNFAAKLALFGLVMLGIAVGSFGKEVAKTLTPDQNVQDTVGIIAGLTAAVSPIAGLIAWNSVQQNKRNLAVSNLIEVDENARKRINRKIASMMRQLGRVRNYERHVWGIGDFTPFIRVRRYVRPTPSLINDIDQLERTLINYIAQYRDEASVDEAFNKATEIATKIISQLDKAK